jgi:hypothetical protein
LPKTNRKTPEGNENISYLVNRLIKFPNILLYVTENVNNKHDKMVRPTKWTWALMMEENTPKPSPFHELQNNEHSDALGNTIWAVTQG